MDRIYVEKMEFYGYHGFFPEENRLGQRFIVDLTAELDLYKAGQTDEIQFSVDYGQLYEICKKIVEGQPFKLLETVAEKIAAECLGKFPQLFAITVKVAKPDPPIKGHYKAVAVEITRGRKNG